MLRSHEDEAVAQMLGLFLELHEGKLALLTVGGMSVVDKLLAPVIPFSPDRHVLPVQQAEVLQSIGTVSGVARFRWGMMVLQLPLQVILVLEHGLDAEFVLHRQGKMHLAVIFAVDGFTQHHCA